MALSGEKSRATALESRSLHFDWLKEMLSSRLSRALYRTSVKDGNFVDYLVVKVFGGKGGNGCTSFDRSNNKIKGRPSGGSGGDGGDVIFRVDPSKNSLQHITKTIRAGNGESGGKDNMQGSKGFDNIVELPPGTSVRQVLQSEEAKATGRLNARYTDRLARLDPIDGGNSEMYIQERLCKTNFDFDDPSSPPVTVCRGGKGGRGNVALGKNNGERENGQVGDERVFELDLTTMADIGLVGLPNAGKSSFLSAVSNAHPKIAPYPFTTLNPYIGTIQYSDDIDDNGITVADIPGLIEGAHMNIGLGHQFLKHVVKSRALAFVVDFSRTDPFADYSVLCNELERYKSGLSQRCRLVIANKIDLLDSDNLGRVLVAMKERLPEQVKILPVSAKHKQNITVVTEYMRSIVRQSAIINSRL